MLLEFSRLIYDHQLIHRVDKY